LTTWDEPSPEEDAEGVEAGDEASVVVVEPSEGA
jgi:hypothetical protein